jgi:hypothetical protein
VRYAARCGIALDHGDITACQIAANLVGRMPRKELSQVLVRASRHQEAIQQSLDGIGHFRCGTAISHRPCDGLLFANRSADAEVIGVDELTVRLDLLAFQPEVCDPVLAATVGAASDMQLEVLLEARQTFIEFLRQPAS